VRICRLIVVSVESKKSQKEILDEAVRYFHDNLGLEITERGSCCAYFRDDLGYVNVTLSREEDKFKIDVESREYEYHVKEFAKRFK
jgi:hypothetical protein